MKSMKGLLAATVAIAALSVSANAGATVLTYNVNGVLSNGAVLSGSFSFDTAGTTYSQYSNVNLLVSGLGTFTTVTAVGYSGASTGTSAYSFRSTSTLLPGSTLSLNFMGTHTGLVLNAITGTALNTSTYLARANNATSYLTSGTITAAAAAVPETATWGMMIAGFGLMGAALRYRSRATKVAYA